MRLGSFGVKAMGRGLSKLQRTILEMAYERFQEAMDKYEAGETRGRSKGIYYTVYVGPTLPTEGSYNDFDLGWKLAEQRCVIYPEESWDEAYNAVTAELETKEEQNKATRQEIEEKVRTAAPELWDKPKDNHYYWSPPGWSYAGERGSGFSYDRFKIASFLNNTTEARRYNKLLEEKGLPWGITWGGGGIVYTGEVLEKAYGFKPRYKLDTWREWPFRDGIKFDPEAIGPERYNRARAAVSRALKRLYSRTLIELSYGSAMITLEGIAELTGQTVNEICTAHKINRSDGMGRLLIDGEPKREPNPESGETIKSLQNILSPPPPALADIFRNAIEIQLAHDPSTTDQDIQEAFTEALERIKEEIKAEAPDKAVQS